MPIEIRRFGVGHRRPDGPPGSIGLTGQVIHSVGDERTRIAAGEAAVWPADVIHSAWTEHSEMRAFVIELTGPDDTVVVAGSAAEVVSSDRDSAAKAVGQLAPRPARLSDGDPREGEPS
jgi:hypothetical protein